VFSVSAISPVTGTVTVASPLSMVLVAVPTKVNSTVGIVSTGVACGSAYRLIVKGTSLGPVGPEDTVTLRTKARLPTPACSSK
jgi:hypothetical protein